MRLIRSFFTLPIRLYQRFLSPLLPARCRYYPTCSSYAIEAVQVHGVLKGSVLGSWRVLRCNPWSLGGVDHVPEPGSWKASSWVPPEDWVGYDLQKRNAEDNAEVVSGTGNEE